MIPIKATGDLSAYREYISGLRSKISEVIDKRYFGNRKRYSLDRIEEYYDSLPAESQPHYLNKVGKGYGSLSDIRNGAHEPRDILAPPFILSDEEVGVLTDLKDDIDELTEASPEQLKILIERYKGKFPVENDQIDKSSVIYRAVYYIFVGHGFENSEFKELVWKITDLKVCPYCNRTYIPLIKFENDDKSIKGQLDHFYPKEIYPYLAVSLHNLVPCCSYCNGHSCKSVKDPYDEAARIVNPFALSGHKGLKFRLLKFDSGILDLKKCAESIEIGIDTSENPMMNVNARVFHLKDIYMFHRDVAAEIIFKHQALSRPVYINSIKYILRYPALHLGRRDLSLLFWGVPLSEERLGERPLSKFTLDIINQLSEVDPLS